MNQWTEYYRRQIVAGIGDLAKLGPESARDYDMLNSGAEPEHLDPKTRELIALAVAVTVRCDGCIMTHAEAARGLGVTAEELAEALGVTASINAGAAVVYSARAFDAFASPGEP